MRICTIDGYNVTIDNNWSINKTIDASDTFNFTIVNFNQFTNITNLSNNLVVEFNNGSNNLFKGLIKNYELIESTPGELNCNVSCLDFNSICDRRKVALSIVSTTIDEIITDNLMPILAEEGVTIGYISAPTAVAKAVFNYISIRDCFNYLKDLGTYTWSINSNKELNFYAKADIINPVTLSNLIRHNNFRKSSNMDTYRNVQYIRSGKVRTNTLVKELATPQPYADKDDQNYFVRYPIAEKPQIYINDIEVSSSDIGINGIDTGKKWYFSYNSNILSQDAGETALTSGKLEITYVGLRDAITKAENTAEIQQRKLIESTSSGRYEEMSKAAFLDTTTQSIEYANAILKKYGEISDGVTFSLIDNTYNTGELIYIDKPLFDIKDYFLCTNISIESYDAFTEEVTVNCLDGASVGGWEEYFRKLSEIGKDFIISEGEVLIILNQVNEGLIDYGYYVYKVCANVLYVSESTIVSPSLILNNSVVIDYVGDV